MINGLAHVALYTDKFEETIAFYKEALQASEINRFQTDKNGCNLQMGTFILEVFEVKEPTVDGSFKHIALSCDNVDEAYNYAISKGATPYIAPKDIHMKLNKRIAFVKGINNEQIELVELQKFGAQ